MVSELRKSHTRVFKSNKSQAVRLPKPVALPDAIIDVEIVAVGNKRIITPAGRSWDDWFDGPGVSSDFMTTREQPTDQERESL
jgi:antitoxin VapB